MPLKTLFPSLILHESLLGGGHRGINLKELIKEVQQIRNQDLLGQEWSSKNYPGGYTSYSSLDQLHIFSSSFTDLEKKIDFKVKKFARNLEMDLQGKKLKMTSFWINIMPSQVVHGMHIHPLSVVSGTVYLQTPQNCSALKFEDPRLGYFMASPPRKENAKTANQRFVSISPKAGDLILFESWMRHEVPQNMSKSERISLSFNYDWQ